MTEGYALTKALRWNRIATILNHFTMVALLSGVLLSVSSAVLQHSFWPAGISIAVMVLFMGLTAFATRLGETWADEYKRLRGD